MFDHRVKNRQQFTHTCQHGDHALFACREQSCVKIPAGRIASGSDPSCQVQSAAHRGPTTPDGATAFERPAVAVKRRYADQSRDLFTVELSQFWQLGQKYASGDRTDIEDAEEQIFILFPDRAVMDASVQIIVVLIQFGLQPADVSVDAFGNGLGSRSQPVSLGHHHLGDLSSARGQGSELQGERAFQPTGRFHHDPYGLNFSQPISYDEGEVGLSHAVSS